EQLLQGFVPVEAENLLVGLAPADDAAVYKLDNDRALVFTLDFFPPLVDDPATFGRIAATNALNDVFAMGGAPLLALSIAAFPEELPTSVLGEILAGADEQVRAAGALLAGGHTIRDHEPKYGLAVVGTAHPEAVWQTSTARPGHAHEMASRSGVRLVLDAGSWPALDGALEVARQGERTGGDRRNRDFAAAHVSLDGTSEELVALGYDPQTSGGLLVAVPADRGAVLAASFDAAGLFLRRIGRVDEGEGVVVACT